jgi:hypothetical protein
MAFVDAFEVPTFHHGATNHESSIKSIPLKLQKWWSSTKKTQLQKHSSSETDRASQRASLQDVFDGLTTKNNGWRVGLVLLIALSLGGCWIYRWRMYIGNRLV